MRIFLFFLFFSKFWVIPEIRPEPKRNFRGGGGVPRPPPTSHCPLPPLSRTLFCALVSHKHVIFLRFAQNNYISYLQLGMLPLSESNMLREQSLTLGKQSFITKVRCTPSYKRFKNSAIEGYLNGLNYLIEKLPFHSPVLETLSAIDPGHADCEGSRRTRYLLRYQLPYIMYKYQFTPCTYCLVF